MLKKKGLTIVEILIVTLVAVTVATWILPILLRVEVKAMFPQMLIDVQQIEQEIDRHILERSRKKTGIRQFKIRQNLPQYDYFTYELGLDVTSREEEWRIYVTPKETPNKTLCYRRITRQGREWIIYKKHPWAKYLKLPDAAKIIYLTLFPQTIEEHKRIKVQRETIEKTKEIPKKYPKKK